MEIMENKPIMEGRFFVISKRILVLLILFTFLIGSNVSAREIFFEDLNVNADQKITVNAVENMQKYTIKKGDTLYRLGKQFNVDWKEIESSNPGINASSLKIGAVIQIPSTTIEQEKVTTKVTTYVIKKGDTLWGLAKTYGVPLEQLLSANVALDPKRLKIGEKVQIPNVVKIASVSNTKAVTASRSNILKTGYFTLTAYTAGPESTGKSPGHPEYGITFSGIPVQRDVTIAVDPNVIPLGTRVYIEGIGYRVAHDTGGAIKGNRIDVYMEDLSEALEFGVKKNVRVDILQ